jgi:hypothetical protein
MSLSQELNEKKEAPEIFIVNETAYNCKIKISEQLTLTLRNAEKFLNTTAITAPYFYPGTKEKEILDILYTKEERDKGDKK